MSLIDTGLALAMPKTAATAAPAPAAPLATPFDVAPLATDPPAAAQSAAPPANTSPASAETATASPALASNPAAASTPSLPPPPAWALPQELPLRAIDTVFALLLFVLSFLLWEWRLLDFEHTGVGLTLYFLLNGAATGVYLHLKGYCQNTATLPLLLAVIAGALPFGIYGARDINIFLVLFELTLCLLWVAFTCRNRIMSRLNGFVSIDAVLQVCAVPFANFGRWFTAVAAPFAGTGSGTAKGTGKGEKTHNNRARLLLIVVLSMVTTVPLVVFAAALLSATDTGFANWLNGFWQLWDTAALWEQGITWAWELALALPVACYLFGSVYGNSAHRHTRLATQQGLEAGFASAHRLSRAAFYVPLAAFLTLYLVYFVTMGSYLFSGLSGGLPQGYTYAEYARQGFFELCGVALLNLVVIGAVYCFAARAPRVYPRVLRVLTAVLAMLTCLLIITAASKMLLYVYLYGLSPLRVYTLWFMLVLLVVFVLLTAWHVRPFNAARPLIAAFVVLTLALGLSNTGGIIAGYNTQRYLDNPAVGVDITLLHNVGNAALPALEQLGEYAPEPALAREAQRTIEEIWQESSPYAGSQRDQKSKDYGSQRAWLRWNMLKLV